MPPRDRLPLLLGACGIALPLVLGLGGAASRPGGLALGVPKLGLTALVVIAVAGLFFAARRRPTIAASAGLLAPIVLLLAGVPLAGVKAVSGPPLFALAGAGLVLVIAALGWRLPRLLFLPLAFAVLLVAAGRTHVRVGLQGDEPHYLMVADSLLRDGDVSLERDYAEGRYRAFHDAPLAPHYRVRGRGGAIYSLHALGLSLLILPAWGLAGAAGVCVFLALLAALLAVEVRGFVRDLTGREDLADAVGWLLLLSPPLLPYAGLVFTEVPAALALVFGLRRGRREALGWGGALAIGLAAASLPWLNVRYAPLALVVLTHAAWRHRTWREWGALALPALASGVGIALYHHALYGFWDPRRVYGPRPEFALASLTDGLPGLFLDQEFGLFVYAPLLALALPGFVLLIRRDRRLGWLACLAVVAVVVTAGSWHMWRGGFNPPGRFLVPVVPLLVVAVACLWERRGLTAGGALLAGWGLWIGIAGVMSPELVHRDRDDTAAFFRREAGAREWTTLLPGYVLAEADRHRLAAVWAIALAAAVPWRRRRPTAWRVAVAALGLVAAAQAVSALSTSSAADRDAMRLLDRESLLVPGWRFVGGVPAQWDPRAFGWGPLYEPHRHPDGAAIGRRLPLAPGRYRLDIRGDRLSLAAPPDLLVIPDPERSPWRAFQAEARTGGLAVAFDVRPGAASVDLRLRGGGPILLESLTLREQPFSR